MNYNKAERMKWNMWHIAAHQCVSLYSVGRQSVDVFYEWHMEMLEDNWWRCEMTGVRRWMVEVRNDKC